MLKTKDRHKDSDTIIIDVDEMELQPIEAEYQVYDESGSPVRESAARRVNRKLTNFKKSALSTGVPQMIAEGAKITGKMVVWCAKQLVSIMSEGIKGVGSGMVEAGAMPPASRGRVSRPRQRQQSSYVDNRSYTIIQPSAKKKKPFWYIPTKEEEMIDNL